jgi:hypothetical protein
MTCPLFDLAVPQLKLNKGKATVWEMQDERSLTSCSLMMLRDWRDAVVVLPHHFGPTISTAPLASNCSASSLSTTLFMYSAIISVFP